jgi:hypothetical protein
MESLGIKIRSSSDACLEAGSTLTKRFRTGLKHLIQSCHERGKRAKVYGRTYQGVPRRTYPSATSRRSTTHAMAELIRTTRTQDHPPNSSQLGQTACNQGGWISISTPCPRYFTPSTVQCVRVTCLQEQTRTVGRGDIEDIACAQCTPTRSAVYWYCAKPGPLLNGRISIGQKPDGSLPLLLLR